MKILINIPHSSTKGGVYNHYNGLKKYWKNDVRYNVIGRRYGIPGIVFLPFDYIYFIIICFFGKYDIIILNPSLGKTALIRDKWYLRISTFFNKKVLVFFHGWVPELVSEINEFPNKFVDTFDKANGILVLSKEFKTDLLRWGISKPIYLTTTKVEDSLIKSFDINKKKYSKRLLFLARVETYKGVFIAIKAYKEAKNRIPDLTLTIAGDGSQLENAKFFVRNNNIEGVEFLGYVSGKKLIKVFSDADAYILPSFSEGMPTSVLEAMTFGLPIITRPVGGIIDFFENKKMGYLIQSLNYLDYSKAINTLIGNYEYMEKIGVFNHVYAKEHFLASKVAEQLENIILNM